MFCFGKAYSYSAVCLLVASDALSLLAPGIGTSCPAPNGTTLFGRSGIKVRVSVAICSFGNGDFYAEVF